MVVNSKMIWRGNRRCRCLSAIVASVAKSYVAGDEIPEGTIDATRQAAMIADGRIELVRAEARAVYQTPPRVQIIPRVGIPREPTPVVAPIATPVSDSSRFSIAESTPFVATEIPDEVPVTAPVRLRHSNKRKK
jgi:hypothetical protein